MVTKSKKRKVRTFKTDYEYGRKYETILGDYLNKDLLDENKYELFKSKTYPFDLYNNNYICELKTRYNITKDKYPTTIFGASKLTKMEPDKNYVFYFLFTDGLYKWDFNKDEYFIAENGRLDRGRPEFKDHCNIPIKYLQFVTDEIHSDL